MTIPMNEKLAIQIRLGTKDDLPFILDSWIKMTKHTYPNQYALDFHQHFQERLQPLVQSSLTLVAHLEGEPNEVVSYLVYGSFRKRLVIHYAYTKLDARNQGIVRQLIQFANPENMPIVFTHAAKNENMMNALAKKHIFDPSVLQLMMGNP